MDEMISSNSTRESPQETSVSSAALSPAEPAKKSSLGRKVFQNVTAILAGRAIIIPLSIATSILLVRFLGREHMGQYGALYAYLSLFAFLSTGALDQILAREASVRRADAAQIFHVATMVAFAFSLLGAALAYFLGPLFGFHGAMHWLILVAAVDMLILPPFRQPGVIFQVDMRQWFAVGIGVMRQLLWLIAVALMVLHSAAFYHVIITRTICGFAETAATVFLIRKRGYLTGRRHFVWVEARDLVHEAFPLALTTVAISVYQRIDQVMLHKMSGDRVLGPYVVAVQLTEFFSLLPVALMSTLFPTLSRSASDPLRFNRYLRESYRFLLVVVFAACAVITPVAAPFVELFYGKEFLPTAPLLIVLIWSEVPIFFNVVIMNAMIATRIQRFMPLPAFAGAVCNILLNLVLIPRYGALGASWATVISYCLANIILLLFLSETRPLVISGLRVGASPFFIVLLITFILHFLSWSVWIKLAASSLCYTAGVLLTGALLRSDLERIWTTVRRQFA